MDIKPNALRVMVASCRGGVGKTSTVIGLAAAFQRLGLKVLTVDLDFGGMLTRKLLPIGPSGRVPYTITDLSAFGAPLSRVVQHSPLGIDLIAFDFRHNLPDSEEASSRLSQLIWLGDYQVVLLDLPPVTGAVSVQRHYQIATAAADVLVIPYWAEPRFAWDVEETVASVVHAAEVAGISSPLQRWMIASMFRNDAAQTLTARHISRRWPEAETAVVVEETPFLPHLAIEYDAIAARMWAKYKADNPNA